MEARFRGAKGERGERGETDTDGPQGSAGVIPPRIRRAFAYLLLLALALAAANLFWSWHLTTESQAAQRSAQAMAHRQSAVVERKICTTMRELAALRPPAGNPAANPSRAYDQRLHATLDQLGADLGCNSR